MPVDGLATGRFTCRVGYRFFGVAFRKAVDYRQEPESKAFMYDEELWVFKAVRLY